MTDEPSMPDWLSEWMFGPQRKGLEEATSRVLHVSWHEYTVPTE